MKLCSNYKLINPMTGQWDEEILHDNFWGVINVVSIFRIPLPNHGQPDFIVWQFNKSGCLGGDFWEPPIKLWNVPQALWITWEPPIELWRLIHFVWVR
jgi:hypothetical protein